MRQLFVSSCALMLLAKTLVAGQQLPRPNDLSRSQSVRFNPSTRGNASNALPEATVARAMAARAVASLDALTSRVQSNLARIRRLKQLVAQAEAQVRALVADKLRVLAELRAGYYCSQCHRSKTEIERGGENFMEHLVRVNGHIVPAPQSEIDAKASEYDSRIANAQQAVEAARAQRDSQVPELERENQDARDQIQQGIYLWRSATTLEPSLLAAKEDEAESNEKKTIAEAQAQLQSIQNERARLSNAHHLDEATARALDSGMALWQSVMDRARQEGAERYPEFLKDTQSARDQKIKEFNVIGSYLTRTDQQSFYNGAGGLQQIPKFELSLAGVTVYNNPERMGIRFAFGELPGVGKALSSSLEVQTTTSGYDVRGFLSLFGKLHAGVTQVTTFTPDGVEMSDRPILRVDRVSNKPKPTIVLPKPDFPAPPPQILPKP